ncbi:sigma-70 family RNA polymerase sigma factor, partial [Candidatus Poribacteria bacterium]|nr:sigma-70 family RNA polymerase sigma factor [Candidatus Poribacteria bacterium]
GAAADAPAPELEADEAMIRRETANAVWDAVSDLSEMHRQVVWLFYVDDAPIEEIAKRLGIRPGTVKSRLHHARSRLAAKLEPDFRQ